METNEEIRPFRDNMAFQKLDWDRVIKSKTTTMFSVSVAFGLEISHK
jgi:hypothetical protein